MDICRTYTELSKLYSFEDRYNYLKLDGKVGIETFGFDRYLNQYFYRSKEWDEIRNYVISRDNGSDLGLADFPISGMVLVHHMNPVKIEDIVKHENYILDPEYLISCKLSTHNGIHYGRELNIRNNGRGPVIRQPGDTTIWK